MAMLGYFGCSVLITLPAVFYHEFGAFRDVLSFTS